MKHEKKLARDAARSHFERHRFAGEPALEEITNDVVGIGGRRPKTNTAKPAPEIRAPVGARDWIVGSHARPAGVHLRRRGSTGQGYCYQWAYELAQARPEFRLVEGWAVLRGEPFHHAWCVDRHDTVVDVAWPVLGERYHGPEVPVLAVANAIVAGMRYFGGLLVEVSADVPTLAWDRRWAELDSRRRKRGGQ